MTSTCFMSAKQKEKQQPETQM